MVGCPWWAWAASVGLLICLIPVAAHALDELRRWWS